MTTEEIRNLKRKVELEESNHKLRRRKKSKSKVTEEELKDAGNSQSQLPLDHTRVELTNTSIWYLIFHMKSLVLPMLKMSIQTPPRAISIQFIQL